MANMTIEELKEWHKEIESAVIGLEPEFKEAAAHFELLRSRLEFKRTELRIVAKMLEDRRLPFAKWHTATFKRERRWRWAK